MKFLIPFLVLATATGSATAQEVKLDKVLFIAAADAQERINASGKLRILSQLIPAEACQLISDIDPKKSRAALINASTTFEKILTALEKGDGDLGLDGAEQNRKTLGRINKAREVWTPYKAATDALLAGKISDSTLPNLIEGSSDILSVAQTLVIAISGQYSNPAELVQADAFLIDIAGRQRMLLAKMAKESCVAMIDPLAPLPIKALRGSMQTFTSSLKALLDGMPSAGIRPPPTPEIADGLAGVMEMWREVMPTLDQILTGHKIDPDVAARTFIALNAMIVAMNDTVVEYTLATKPAI